jgi:hypothetical protein
VAHHVANGSIHHVIIGEIGQARTGVRLGNISLSRIGRRPEEVGLEIGVDNLGRVIVSGEARLPAEQLGTKLSWTSMKGLSYEAPIRLVSPRADGAVVD